MITTERRLQRLAITACDAGARFAREGIPHDPAAWMLAPRRLFDGARALEACQEHASFLRATLLHGLSLGLDADPAEIDALLQHDADFDDEDCGSMEQPASTASRGDDGIRLYTATLEGRVGIEGRFIQAFCAMVAPGEEVVRRRLRVRYGERLGDAALVDEGFDRDGLLAKSLLSPGMSRMLDCVAADPTDESGAAFEIHVEQRFAS